MINPFYKIREEAFNEMQKEAGIVVTTFDESDPYKSPDSKDIFATTTGGLHLRHEIPYNDLGENVDNCPVNVKELKERGNESISLEFSSLTFNPDSIAFDLGAADKVLKETGATHVTPRKQLKDSDFVDEIYVIFPLAAGILGAVLYNVLSTGGVDIQTTKNDRGTRAVTMTPHFSIYEQNKVPIDYFFIPALELGAITVTSTAGSTAGTSNIAVSGYTPDTGETYKYKVADAVIDVAYGDIVGADWVSITPPTDITAATGKKITVVSVDTDNYAVAAGNATITAAAAGA